jgi:hypothetical protein
VAEIWRGLLKRAPGKHAGQSDIMRTVRRTFLAAFLASAVSIQCGSPASDTAAPSPPPPPPAGPFVDVSGTWAGTLASSNYPTSTITMTVVQTLNCVDGVWESNPASWTGAISGYAGADSFAGQMSLEFVTDSGAHCNIVGPVSGSVDQTRILWTSTGFVAGACPSFVPKSLVVSLQRK